MHISSEAREIFNEFGLDPDSLNMRNIFPAWAMAMKILDLRIDIAELNAKVEHWKSVANAFEANSASASQAFEEGIEVGKRMMVEKR